MSKQTTIDELNSFNQDWGGNGQTDKRGHTNPYSGTTDNLPFSGLQVQKFIKTALQSVGDKIGMAEFDSLNSRLLCFKSNTEYERWVAASKPYPSEDILLSVPFDFSNVVYNFKIVSRMNEGSTTVYYTTQQQVCNLVTSFISQSKGINEQSWVNTGEDASVIYYVDKGDTGVWTQVYSSDRLRSGQDCTVDIKDYLAVGANKVRVTMVGLETGQRAILTFSVTLTSMYLESSNFAWNTPFIEGSVYSLGGMHIGGALQKTLTVKITKGQVYSRTYTQNLGTQTWTDNDYFFTGLEFPTEGTGVYSVEIYVSAQGIESSHLKYNIMCVKTTHIATAQLVCVNNVPEQIVNFASSKLFDYAVYNQGLAVGSPHLTVQTIIRFDPETWLDVDLNNVPTVTKQTYSVAPSIESDKSDIAIIASIAIGQSVPQVCNYLLDNSASYPPTAGAVFYLNPAMRNNTDTNKTLIVNDVTGATISAVNTKMAFSGSGDGYTTDPSGRKCLLVPAGSSINANTKLLGSLGANGAKTIEFNFMVKNVSNADDIVLSIMDDRTKADFVGIRVKANEICAHSSFLKSAGRDSVQSYNFMDGELVNAIVTFTRNYKTNYGNLCTIYVNGSKKCEFEYDTSDDWTNQGNLIIGGTYSDIYVYGIRTYNIAFGHADAFKNYVASLSTETAKAIADAAGRAVINDSWQIDYDAVKNVANTMIVEITDQGGVIPHYGLSKDYATHSNLEFHYKNHPDWDFRIRGIETTGQGTTSMNYWRWNLRFRIDKTNSDKKCYISYWDTENQAWGNESYSKTVLFDGNNHTALSRITAKKNYASSMQSHKMGATAAFNDLHDAIVGQNEAQGRVAVFQHPFYGFEKRKVEGTQDQYTYTFIGLYTAGPDKGDKATFGYGNTYKNTEITLEGVDHTQALAKFAYPWNSQVKYINSQECLCVDKGSGVYDKGLEVSNCHNIEIGSRATSEDQSAINAALVATLKPAYEVAYNNSTLILGVSQTLAQINADVTSWRANKTSDHRSYEDLEFYTNGVYDLYYYDVPSGQYAASGVNLLTQYTSRGGSASDLQGKTDAEILEIFKTSRRENFTANVWTYFHKDDTLFAYTFLVMLGATDNFAKNMYPYHFGAAGSKWRWRQDDLDTIFDIDNQGHSAKHYSIEYGDFTDAQYTAKVFRGENSTFWTLIHECFRQDILLMGNTILTQMISMSNSGLTSFEKLVGFFKKYFWDNAQNYFAKTAYNLDAEYSYEEAWPNYQQSYQVDTNPLEQSLGDHYESEYMWVYRRVIFLLSKFRKGPFGSYEDSCLGRISVRTQTSRNWVVTPAIDMYPAGFLGSSGKFAASRVKAGVPYTIENIGGSNTNTYIQASDWMEELGDLKDIVLDSTAASMTLGGARLKKIKVGDAVAANVTSNLKDLTIAESPCLTEIDARNLASLTGTIDLTHCPRLLKAYFIGTSISQISIADGSKITELSIPGTTVSVSLLNVSQLTAVNFTYPSLGNLTTMRMENCVNLDPFGIMTSLYNTAGQKLKYIRLIGINSNSQTLGMSGAAIVTMLSHIAQNIDKDGANHQYFGISATGEPDNAMAPVLQGTLVVPHAYQEDAVQVQSYFTGLALTVSGGWYINFLDATFKANLITHHSADGSGVLNSEIIVITTFGTELSSDVNKANIHDLSDLYKITHLTMPNVQSASNSQFYGLTGITKIKFPVLLATIGSNTFNGINALEKLDFSLCTSLTSIASDAFVNCVFAAGADAVDLSPCSSLTSADLSGLGGDRTIRIIGNNTITTLKI